MSTYYEQWGYADPPVDGVRITGPGINLDDVLKAAGMAFDKVFHVKHENAVSWVDAEASAYIHTITPARRALDGPWEERLYGADAPPAPSWELVENITTMRAGWFRPPYLRAHHD